MFKSTKAEATKTLAGAALKAHVKAVAKARTDRNAKWLRRIRSVITGIAVTVIAGAAAVVSFDHIRDLAILAGQDGRHWYSPASLYPITVDLLMIVASFKLREVGVTRLTRLISRLSMWVGLAASLGGNVGTAILLSPNGSVNWLAVGLAAWPVVPLFAATEMLTHTHKDAPVMRKKVDGVVALTRQIVRQWFINKLANMKRRNGSAAPVTAKQQAEQPLIKVVAPRAAELRVPEFPQFRQMLINARGK